MVGSPTAMSPAWLAVSCSAASWSSLRGRVPPPNHSGMTRMCGRSIRLTTWGLPSSLSITAASYWPIISSLCACSMASRVALLVGDDGHGGVEGRLLRPCLLAEVEHALAHDARAGALERLPGDVVVAPFLAAFAQVEVLPEEPLREDPRLQFHPLRHPALQPRVLLPLLGRGENAFH